MAHRCEVKCPYCGDTHTVEVPSRFPRVQGVHPSNAGLFLNYVGLFRRLSDEIERRCPKTRQLYHVVCARKPARS
ncbi:MAG: hypothetical protein JSW27_10760 [Phycisphaerales bacterium]|nr:MAG: hypothetical protein JSW27_10760 [Phycisphaerales bacterium]